MLRLKVYNASYVGNKKLKSNGYCKLSLRFHLVQAVHRFSWDPAENHKAVTSLMCSSYFKNWMKLTLKHLESSF